MTAEPDNEGQDNHFLGVRHSLWSALSGFLAVTGAVVGVVGIVFAGYQYLRQVEADRAEQTLNLIDIWETRGYREDFKGLRDGVQNFLSKVPPADLEAARQNALVSRNLRDRLLSEVLGTEENQERLNDVIYFFNRLGLCIEADLCSRETAAIFFDDSLTNFLSHFEPVISSRRETDKGYAEGVLLLRSAIEQN